MARKGQTRRSSIKSPSLRAPSSSQKSPKSPRMGRITRGAGGPKISRK